MQPSPTRRRAALLLASVVSLPMPAAAHAIVISAAPAVDAVLRSGSVPIELRFNSRIDQRLSRVTLTGPDGKTAILTLGASTSPDLLTAEAHGLAPGAWRLHWQVLSVDGHITRGDIPFTVGP